MLYHDLSLSYESFTFYQEYIFAFYFGLAKGELPLFLTIVVESGLESLLLSEIVFTELQDFRLEIFDSFDEAYLLISKSFFDVLIASAKLSVLL